MANNHTDKFLENNKRYANGEAVHNASHPGEQPINPDKNVAVIACMDARMDVEDLNYNLMAGCQMLNWPDELA